MNIEKLAKRLKEFTLDDIELIAECDCKTKLIKYFLKMEFINTMINQRREKIMKYSARKKINI